MSRNFQDAVVFVADQLYRVAYDNWRWWHLRRRPKTPMDFIPAARFVVSRLMSEGFFDGSESK